MKRKDLQHIQIKSEVNTPDEIIANAGFQTAEGIELKPTYSEQDIQDYKSGVNPYSHPNVNWWDETFKDYKEILALRDDMVNEAYKFKYLLKFK